MVGELVVVVVVVVAAKYGATNKMLDSDKRSKDDGKIDRRRKTEGSGSFQKKEK